jgi:hypothetical protein
MSRRNRHDHARSSTFRSARAFDASTMELHDLPAHAEPDAGAARVPPIVDMLMLEPEELVEDPPAKRVRDTWARIHHRDRDGFTLNAVCVRRLDPSRYRDFSVGWRVLQGIRQQLIEDDTQPAVIGHNRREVDRNAGSQRASRRARRSSRHASAACPSCTARCSRPLIDRRKPSSAQTRSRISRLATPARRGVR